MNRLILLLLFFCLYSFLAEGQNLSAPENTVEADSLYREDQFYFGITYNLLVDKPGGVFSRGLSGGIQGGFLRDFPLNKQRDIAVAVGLGLTHDQFGSNLAVREDKNDKRNFRVMENSADYNQNRFGMTLIEIPFEFRWRTSTATDYKFWRVYAGGRIGYAFWYKSYFKSAEERISLTNIPEFERLRLSATLSLGYGAVNFYGAYTLNPFFSNAFTEDGEKIELRMLKFGLIFYIL